MDPYCGFMTDSKDLRCNHYTGPYSNVYGWLWTALNWGLEIILPINKRKNNVRLQNILQHDIEDHLYTQKIYLQSKMSVHCFEFYVVILEDCQSSCAKYMDSYWGPFSLPSNGYWGFFFSLV